ncbi:xanthine dehydrogenase family protein molybdopterin-binding subunit [Sandaracinobacteroides hominis]|uniref:xanthine dehydrogenase family protein molybdopterin-binding subunit n=1 Tax=Sandaracinobacteroides hominis TaxID=2780086 RepID=UPI0018F62A63|nr:molybdopterin cofactor-binding domain-containing protein [Sandaracinobacteroides hominis]
MLQRSPETPENKPGATRFLPSRRGFLIGTGATVGLVVGYALWPRTYPGGWTADEGETLLGPWVKIGPDGRVTVPVPQAEMGQGVMSGFAQIVADELGAAWKMMAVEPAPWHPDYANVGMAYLGTKSLPPMVRGLGSRIGVEVIRRMNLHLTGGSTSIKSYHDQLRGAAAEARQRLVAAAAKEWGVSAGDVDTADNFVVYKANRMAFADAVKLVDATADVPEAKLRAPSAQKLAGKALPRIDLPPKVDGSARYGGDVRLPGMVYAAIRHGPVGASKLVSAKAPAGVTLVKGPSWVATVGATTWDARRMLESVEASFSVEGRKAGPWIAEELAKAASGDGGGVVAEEGDVEPRLGSVPVTAEYSLPFLSHATMEPMTATARVTGGQAEVWGPIQSLTIGHMQVADALGLETDAVVIHPTIIGGGFGRKAEADAMVEAALIARAVGKPVQLIWSREEDMGSGRYRPPVHARMRGAVTPERGIAAWDARVAVPDVGNSFMSRNMPMMAKDKPGPSAPAIEGLAEIPYATESFRVAHIPIEQPVPLGYWRSVGHSFSGFVVESFADELAAAAGADPLNFRLELLKDKPRHAAVLKAAADAGRWNDPAPRGFARGIALHESFGSIAAMVVLAGLVEGKVKVLEVATAIDCGRAIAPDSVRAQLEGAAIMGLSAAIGEAVTFEDGEAQQRNFHMYPVLQMADTPVRLVTVILDSGAELGGVGEPGLPCAAPALANALAKATGKRARSLPLAQVYTA